MDLSFAINNLGVLYTRLNQYDIALDYLLMHATTIAQYLPRNYYDRGAVLKNLGHVYMLQGKMEERMKYYMRAMQFFR